MESNDENSGPVHEPVMENNECETVDLTAVKELTEPGSEDNITENQTVADGESSIMEVGNADTSTAVTELPESCSSEMTVDEDDAKQELNETAEKSINAEPESSVPPVDDQPPNESNSELKPENVDENIPTTSVPKQPTKSHSSTQGIYHVKNMMFNSKKLPIITQNENGPCPLLAIMNILLLREKIKLPATQEIITSEQLMEYLGDFVFEQIPKNISEDAQLNFEQNMHDAMAVFHKLQTGLDVNVRFTGIGSFEYTSEHIIFDLLSIPMYHGWLVDPQSPEVAVAVGNCSYNQLVEKIINQKSSDDEDLVSEALIAENYLERTASQLTYHGLAELVITVKEGEMCVLFRNNHFSTLYKHNNELFTLVTDQGFLNENEVVWETLSNVEGDGHFVNSEFRTYQKPESGSNTVIPMDSALSPRQQIDHDYLVALSLQEEAGRYEQASASASAAPLQQMPNTLSDHELAVQLQEEENRQAAAARQQQQTSQQQQQPQASGGRPATAETQNQDTSKKESDCRIL